jgi:hypothetical protein
VPKITKADLCRLADLARALNLDIASVETTPGRVRLVTTAGRNLTLPDDEETLDRELSDFRAANGNG